MGSVWDKHEKTEASRDQNLHVPQGFCNNPLVKEVANYKNASKPLKTGTVLKTAHRKQVDMGFCLFPSFSNNVIYCIETTILICTRHYINHTVLFIYFSQ